MKNKTLLLVLVFSLVALITDSTEFHSRQSELTAALCIERPENNGSMNLAYSEVVFSNQQTLNLVGGQAACILVAPDTYTIFVQSADFYHEKSNNPTAWKSQKIKVTLQAKQTKSFEVLPKSNKSTYTGGWIIRPLK